MMDEGMRGWMAAEEDHPDVKSPELTMRMPLMNLFKDGRRNTDWLRPLRIQPNEKPWRAPAFLIVGVCLTHSLELDSLEPVPAGQSI